MYVPDPTTSAGPAANRGKPALIFIFFTVLIDTIGLGIIIPVMPKLIMGLTGEGESRAALYGGWLQFSYAAMQFLCGPIMGSLSDRFGRRPVLLLSLFVFGLDYIVMGIAPALSWLFVGRVIAGICGASYTTAFAYIADVTTPEKRAQSFGLVGAAFGLGFIFGSAIGGVLGEYGPRIPFFAAAGMALLNMTYGYFVVPETLPPERRRAFSWKRANVLGSIAHLRLNPLVIGLAAALFCWQLAHMAVQSTWSYYTMLRFNWSTAQVGYSLAWAGITMAIVQGGLTRVLVPRLGERRAGLLGLMLGTLGYLCYAFASQGWMMYAGVAVYALAGLVYPSINALMSKQVDATMQGELQGALSSIQGLTAIIGPPMMTHLFGYFSTADAGHLYFPGAAFAFSAMLTVGSAALFIRAAFAARPEATN